MQKKKVQQLVAPHIARSAWYGHSEAVLQTLPCREEQEERTKAVKDILKLRDGRAEGDLTIISRVHSTFKPHAKKLDELTGFPSETFPMLPFCTASGQRTHSDRTKTIQQSSKRHY